MLLFSLQRMNQNKRQLQNLTAMDKNLILYDGECGFCNKTILFLAEKDIHNHFIFVSNVSRLGQEFLQKNNLIETTKTTIILVEQNHHFTKGKAIKMISKKLAIHPVLQFLVRNTPIIALNFFYTIIAKNRLALTNNNCRIPSPEIRSKFIVS